MAARSCEGIPVCRRPARAAARWSAAERDRPRTHRPRQRQPGRRRRRSRARSSPPTPPHAGTCSRTGCRPARDRLRDGRRRSPPNPGSAKSRMRSTGYAERMRRDPGSPRRRAQHEARLGAPRGTRRRPRRARSRRRRRGPAGTGRGRGKGSRRGTGSRSCRMPSRCMPTKGAPTTPESPSPKIVSESPAATLVRREPQREQLRTGRRANMPAPIAARTPSALEPVRMATGDCRLDRPHDQSCPRRRDLSTPRALHHELADRRDEEAASEAVMTVRRIASNRVMRRPSPIRVEFR